MPVAAVVKIFVSRGLGWYRGSEIFGPGDEVPEAASYVVRLAAEGDETANVHRVSRPSLDMSGIWGRLPYGLIDMLIEGHDTEGRETCVSQYKGFYKIH